MLTLMHHTTHVPPHPFPTLEVLLAEPFPHTPQEMLQLEQRLSTAAAQTADQILPDSSWVGTRRVALRYVSSSPPLSTVHATFTAHGATPLVGLHGPP